MTAAYLWPDRVFDHRDRPDRVVLVGEDGSRHRMSAGRWHGPVTSSEKEVLRRAVPPVLDVGCGPGRHAAHLSKSGAEVLGVDSSPAAVRAARRRGAPAVQRSVFDPVPRSGEWRTILLLDGNVGIGGDPVTLLGRCRDLLCPGGRLLVETEPLAHPDRRSQVRLEFEDRPGEAVGPWFPWAVVSAGEIHRVAADSGFAVIDAWCSGGRWYAELR